MLRKITASESLVVSVERAKLRLRVDENEDEEDGFDDEDLELLIQAATGVVEKSTGRTLRPTSFELRTDEWPGVAPICLPAYPIRDVEEVVYLDEAGSEQPVDADDWYWDLTEEGGDLRLVDTFSGPALYDRPGSVRVRFSAGYDVSGESGSGDDPELRLTAEVELAVLFLVAHWYASREPVNVGNVVAKVPDTFELIAAQLRIYR